MDAGLFVLLFLLALVVISVICVMRVRQFGAELSHLRDDVDVLRNAALVNAQICHDVAAGENIAEVNPTDDLQTLLANSLVQQVLDQR